MNIGFGYPNEVKVIMGMTQKDYISKKFIKYRGLLMSKCAL